MGDSQRPASLADTGLFGNRAPLNPSVAHHNPPQKSLKKIMHSQPFTPDPCRVSDRVDYISKSVLVVPEMWIYSTPFSDTLIWGGLIDGMNMHGNIPTYRPTYQISSYMIHADVS